MRPIVGRVAGLIPANFGPRAIMHFLLAARRKIVQELHDRRGGPAGVASWYYSPLGDVITVHAGEARSRARYWGRGPRVAAAIGTRRGRTGGRRRSSAW